MYFTLVLVAGVTSSPAAVTQHSLHLVHTLAFRSHSLMFTLLCVVDEPIGDECFYEVTEGNDCNVVAFGGHSD